MSTSLRHGIFLGPWHALDESPTLAIQRDLKLVQLLDELGFAEVWIGEHHSGGWEMITSPDLFIAGAAERTKRIRLGTGVVSVSYHNPFIVAERLMQLDHQTMGRVMFGFGPGLLATDAHMLGIPQTATRDRLAQALEVIVRLFDGEVVTEETDWYSLHDARLQLLPYQQPRPEIAVTSVFTPSGGRLAGKLGLSMLCVAASDLRAFDALAGNWQIAVDTAARHGQTVSRSQLRLVAPMHLAATREEARENVRFGLSRYMDYANAIQKRFEIPDGVDPADFLVDSHYAVIRTPDDAIAMIDRLREKQGDFGTFLIQAFNWADWPATQRSYELYARYVMPHFSDANVARSASLEWMRDKRDSLSPARAQAVQEAFEKYGTDVGASEVSDRTAKGPVL